MEKFSDWQACAETPAPCGFANLSVDEVSRFANPPHGASDPDFASPRRTEPRSPETTPPTENAAMAKPRHGKISALRNNDVVENSPPNVFNPLGVSNPIGVDCHPGSIRQFSPLGRGPDPRGTLGRTNQLAIVDPAPPRSELTVDCHPAQTTGSAHLSVHTSRPKRSWQHVSRFPAKTRGLAWQWCRLLLLS